MKVGLITFLLLTVQINSAVGDEAVFQDEISYLLTFIEKSDCTFIRNGKLYSSVKARQHINKKYDYLRNRISSAEQFIAYTASKSSMSGDKYLITCDTITIASQQWLKAELKRYRENKSVAIGAVGTPVPN